MPLKSSLGTLWHTICLTMHQSPETTLETWKSDSLAISAHEDGILQKARLSFLTTCTRVMVMRTLATTLTSTSRNAGTVEFLASWMSISKRLIETSWTSIIISRRNSSHQSLLSTIRWQHWEAIWEMCIRLIFVVHAMQVYVDLDQTLTEIQLRMMAMMMDMMVLTVLMMEATIMMMMVLMETLISLFTQVSKLCFSRQWSSFNRLIIALRETLTLKIMIL